jgi:chitodextrinase
MGAKYGIGNWKRQICAGLALACLSMPGRAVDRVPKPQAISELRPLQAGVTLPVAVGRTLRAGKVKPGTVFLVKTTQRIPVSEDAYLNRGATVRGEVVTSEAGDGTAAHPAKLTIRFTQLTYRGQTVPLETRAVAMANLMYVDGTFLPLMGGADRGNSSEASWTTAQVGGEQVVRSGWIGPVVGRGLMTVGRADYYGVYSLPTPLHGPDSMMVPRAMGVFSTTAKGLYGYDTGTQLESSGGLITITNALGHAVIRAGDHLLLEVVRGDT